MVCPRCNQEEIQEIIFRNGTRGFLCSYCETVWFAGEIIDRTTGHLLEGYLNAKTHEYTLKLPPDMLKESTTVIKQSYR